MEITVTGLGGLQSALKRIQQLSDQKEMDKKLLEIAERLCQIGEPIIRQVHGHHATNIETVKLEDGSGYKITAEGKDLLFIEFGAGDAAGSENALYDKVPKAARPGSWSEKHAQMYSRYGFWVFAGQIFHEVQPTPAFYYAYEYMVQNLPMIAREVFGR